LKWLFLQKPFPFQRGNVVLDCCRVNSEVPADFAYGRRKAVVLYVLIDEIQYGLLPLGNHEQCYTEHLFGSQEGIEVAVSP
jgi:hypothetical protein